MKKRIAAKVAIALLLCTGIGAIMIVPASMFWIQVPDITARILCVLMVILIAVCLLTGMVRKITGKLILILFTVFAIGVSLLGQYCNPYWNSINMKTDVSFYVNSMDDMLTKAEAIEDLEYAMHYLDKLHPLFFKGQPTEVMTRYQEVLTELDNTKSLSVCELNQKIQYIFSVMRDGHTYVMALPKEPHYRKDIYQLNQANYRTVAINGIELEDLLGQTQDLYSFEVESWQMNLLKSDLSSKERLQYLGFDEKEGVTFTYEKEDGTRESRIYYEEDFLAIEEYNQYNKIELSNDGDESSFVSYEIDAENNVAILTLDSCEYNQVYRECLKEMFTKVKEKQITNVVVDIRDNGGGNSYVANEFIKYLNVEHYEAGSNQWRFGIFMIPSGESRQKNIKCEDLVFDGDVYLLTSADSFSSAMLFAEYIKDNHLGTIIGEAPGNTPNGYGDIAMFKLPNSHMFMQISTKEFFRADRTNESNLVDPDILCDSEKAMEVLYKMLSEK